MTEHEHHSQESNHSHPVKEPEIVAAAENSSWVMAFSIILGAIIICAGLLYDGHELNKSLSSVVLSSAQTSAAPVQPVAQGAAAAGQPAAPSGPVTVANRANQPTLGNANAKVTVVEFGDFQCPFCKQFYQQTFGQIKTNYIDTGKIKYIFRDFPLTQLHVNAQIAAEAAECANQQGKFWQYHDILYTDGQSDGTGLDKASLEKYADTLGLNSGTFGFGKNKFNQCLESNATLSIVNADQAEGAKDGVTGTPSFFINGQLIVGAEPYSQFQQAIDAALKQ
jgi:protein-disulfide isomerase